MKTLLLESSTKNKKAKNFFRWKTRNEICIQELRAKRNCVSITPTIKIEMGGPFMAVLILLLHRLESNREMATGEKRVEDHGLHENACTLKFEPRLSREGKGRATWPHENGSDHPGKKCEKLAHLASLSETDSKLEWSYPPPLTQLVFFSLQLLVIHARRTSFGVPIDWPTQMLWSIRAILRDPNFLTFISNFGLLDLFDVGMPKAKKLKTKD